MAYSKEVIQKAVAKITSGDLTAAQAAKRFNVSRTTIANWMKNYSKQTTARTNRVPAFVEALLTDTTISNQKRLRMFEAYYNA